MSRYCAPKLGTGRDSGGRSCALGWLYAASSCSCRPILASMKPVTTKLGKSGAKIAQSVNMDSCVQERAVVLNCGEKVDAKESMQKKWIGPRTSPLSPL